MGHDNLLRFDLRIPLIKNLLSFAFRSFISQIQSCYYFKFISFNEYNWISYTNNNSILV